MRIASLAEVKARFSAYVKISKEGPVVVTRNGKPVAMLISIEDEEEIERMMMAYSPRLQRILKLAEEQIRYGEGIEHTDLWDSLEDAQDKDPSGEDLADR